MSSRKDDPKFIRAYDRGMLRSAFVSLFWGIITELKRRSGFTLQALATAIGANKAEVSRWFNGDPNWTVNTIASLANALNVDLYLYAVDRATGTIYTPSGIATASQVQAQFQGMKQAQAQFQGIASATNAPSTNPFPTPTFAFRWGPKTPTAEAVGQAA